MSPGSSDGNGPDGEPDTRVGTTVDKYVITKLLGEGGMGAVYEAHNHLSRRFAVKFLRRNFALNQEILRRFENEALAAGRLMHPNIAAALDSGRASDGTPYLVLEYLEGEDCSKLIRRPGPLAVARAVDIVLQASRGLAFAHQAGIIHRDLKPENLFLTRAGDGSDVVKILDFGIAKLRGTENSSLTNTGATFGTPHYMSPEQARDTAHVDQRTDIWSLGVVLYELLSGRKPFEGDSIFDVIHQILTVEPPPLASLRNGLPPALVAVVERAMAKNLSQRTPDAAAIEEALSHIARRSASVRAAVNPLTLLDRTARRDTVDHQSHSLREQQAGSESGLSRPDSGSVDTRGRRTSTRVPRTRFVLPVVVVVAAAIGVGVRSLPRSWLQARSCGEADADECAKQCDGGKLKSCTILGLMYRKGRGAHRDDVSAVVRFKQACDNGEPGGCARLGEMYFMGKGGLTADVARATSLYKQACDKGAALGCYLFAAEGAFWDVEHPGRPYDVEREDERRRELLEEACKKGEPQGCIDLARYPYSKPDRDRPRAFTLFRRACEMGGQVGCLGLGLGCLDPRSGLPRDEARALLLFGQVCEGKGDLAANEDVAPAGCSVLGAVYARGWLGQKKDDAQALGFFKRACDRDDTGRFCVEAGYDYERGEEGITRDNAVALSFYQQACDKTNVRGCAELGLLHERGEGGLPRDLQKAQELFETACDRGDENGCLYLANSMKDRPTGKQPRVHSYELACKNGKGNGEACDELGKMYAFGHDGLTKDEKQAFEFFAAGCSLHFAGACEGLAEYYLSGVGAPKDQARALAVGSEACYRSETNMIDCVDIFGPDSGSAIEGRVKLYQRACDQDLKPAEARGWPCTAMGIMYEYGKGGVKKDEKRAAELLQRACEAQEGRGCTELGDMHLRGAGAFEVDEKVALDFYDKGCSNDQLGCQKSSALIYGHKE